ncbi:MAG TPA: polysaccharide deacetylase family protein [Bacteroidales bacterium]|nr:polysaccharide deacetylase family protein [Bacteroidales bacterium]
MRIFRPCFIARWIFPDALFRIKTKEKLICLTFDDGPDPSSTAEILGILKNHNIRAVFFCSGDKAEKFPELFQRIIAEGHIAGNHGYSHMNGWQNSLKKYTDDIEKASHIIPGIFFRPPYGKIRLCQYMKLKKRFKIMLWDIMPYDFDTSFPPEESLRVLERNIRPGSVITLHDNSGSSSVLILSRFIKMADSRGYRFVLPG